jgi:hypothetical protein
MGADEMNLSRNFRLGLVSLATIVLSAIPIAAEAWSGYNNVTIVMLSVYQAGRGVTPGVLIQFSPKTPTDTEGCTYSGAGYAWIDYSTTGEPDGKQLYAMALAIQKSGGVIGIGTNGCSSQGYPVVYGLNSTP